MEEIGPYRIVRKLGRGGMGEVWLGRDPEGRTVAIKRISGERGADPRARARFRREIRALRQLDHPSIVRCLESFSWEGADYLVMEWIEGELLAERLWSGALPEKQVIRIGLDLASGLAAAHRRSLVHRDLKAENVMVTPEGRGRILDFGLVKSLHPLETTLSDEGKLLGTLHCMAPEQVRGEPVDAQADLFALGALLYEMATGEAPLRGGTSQETLARVCHHHPSPLIQRVAGIPEGLSHLVDHLMRKDRRRRPANAEDVVEALSALEAGSSSAAHRWLAGPATPDPDLATRDGEGELHGPDSSSGSLAPLRRLRRLGFALPLSMLIVSGILGTMWLRHDGRPGPQALPETAPSLTLAVPDAATVGSGQEMPGIAVAEAVARCLDEAGRVSVLRRGAWRYGLPMEPMILDAWAWGSLGVTHELGVRIAPLDGDWTPGLSRFEIELRELESGRIAAAWRSIGSLEEIDSFAIDAANRVHAALDLPPLPPSRCAAHAVFSSLEHARVIAQLRARRWAEALAHLRAIPAAERDRRYWLQRAEVEKALEKEDAAASSAAEGLARGTGSEADVPSTSRSEARLLWLAGKPAAALGVYEILVRARPADHQLRLAQLEAALDASDSRVAAALAEEAAFADRDPRLLWRRAQAHQRVGTWSRQAELASRCRDRAGGLGAETLAAICGLTLASAELARGRTDEARPELALALATFRRLGDRPGISAARELVGIGHLRAGELAEAARVLEEVEQVYEEAGNLRGRARVLTHMAQLASLEGDPAAAESRAERAVELFGDSDRDAEKARALTILATERFFSWRLREAAAGYSQALALADRFGLEDVRAAVLANLSEILFFGGELDEAERLLEQARALDRSRGDEAGLAWDLRLSARVAREAGRPRDARRFLERSLREVDDPAVRLELAELYGPAGQAEARARRVLADSPDPGIHQQARRVVASALAARGRIQDAAKMLEPVIRHQLGADLRTAPEPEVLLLDPPGRVALELLRAELAARLEGEEGLEGKTLDPSLADALRERGFVGLALETRLAAARIAMLRGQGARAGDAAAAYRLERLIEDAEALGYRRIAEEASAMRRRLQGLASQEPVPPDSNPS